MTIQVFNPKWYYISEFTEDQQSAVREYFSDFLSNEKTFQQPKYWACNVRSSYQNPGNNDLPWQKWLDTMKPYFDEFVDQVGAQQNIEIMLEEAWVNKYMPGDSQEVHDHCTPTCNISMVYFYQLNEDDECEFRFYNDDHKFCQLSGLSDTLNIPSEHFTTPKIKTGTLLMFPSHYHHLVTPHRGTQERITFSANFKVIPKGFQVT